MTETPRDISRVQPDLTALRALAHPVRLRMLGMLRLDGPATATRLADRLGLNSGATSYHLRQLARHGFIAEVEDAGSKRDRWWQASHEVTHLDEDSETGEALAVGLALRQAVLSHRISQMQLALAEMPSLPARWRAASTMTDLNIPLTSDAARVLMQKLEALLMEAMAGAPPLGGPLPDGVVPYTVMLHGFPMPGRVPPEDEA